MSAPDRSTTRHYAKRSKTRARKLLKHIFRMEHGLLDDRRIGKRAVTPVPCSCSMCGQRRAFEGPTIGERRAPDIINQKDI